MAKFTVQLIAASSISVTVEADDVDDAIDKAYNEEPGGICAQCSGWNENWCRDEGDSEASEVMDENGNVVWTADSD